MGAKLLLPAHIVLSLGEEQCFSKRVCQYLDVILCLLSDVVG